MYIKTLSIKELNNYIKKVMDNDYILRNVNVEGEISNLKIHNSGHIYFSLKDFEAKVNCIMFKENAQNLNFIPENGMKVIAKGRVSLYTKEGIYQLYCNSLEINGVGQLYEKFEKLKKSLEKKGLFDDIHKNKLPQYPFKIGVITSPTGAAIRDIINVAKRRNPNIDILIYPSLVQGQKASQNIINGIKYLERRNDIDVIIIARGGGSLEELWCFNDENLAYAVYDCSKPIVTGVGHETDFTIVDFVSDKRAPTPSAAAELVIPKLDDIIFNLNYSKNLLTECIKNKITQNYNHINNIIKEMDRYSPINRIDNMYNKLDTYYNKMNSLINYKLDIYKERLNRYKTIIVSHNPLNILDKGYSIITDENDDEVIKNIDVLKQKDKINIRLKDGKCKFRLFVMEDL